MQVAGLRLRAMLKHGEARSWDLAVIITAAILSKRKRKRK
jgi:hypothetical protein